MKIQTMHNAPRLALLVSCLFSVILLAGCASTKVNDQQSVAIGKIPKPNQIWVYDFIATHKDIPADAAIAGAPDLDTTAQTPQQIREGKKLGAEIATQLISDIRATGMPAAHAGPGTKPAVNDLVIRGYLLTIKEGSAAKRVGIGFGEGASELKTAAEGFQMTEHGLRKLGGGTADAGGGKSPGAALGVVGLLATHNPAGLIISSGMHLHDEETGSSTVEGRAKATSKEISDVLKKRFQEQGWISAK